MTAFLPFLALPCSEIGRFTGPGGVYCLENASLIPLLCNIYPFAFINEVPLHCLYVVDFIIDVAVVGGMPAIEGNENSSKLTNHVLEI